MSIVVTSQDTSNMASITGSHQRAIQSGTYSGTPSEFRSMVKAIIGDFTRKGVEIALEVFLQSVAMDTGALRKSLRDMIMRQIKIIPGSKIRIEFDEAALGNIEYSKFHVYDPSRDILTSGRYKNPSVDGTKKINALELMTALHDESINQVYIGFRAYGLEVRIDAT